MESLTAQLDEAVLRWFHAFQHRSMRDFMLFARRSGLSMVHLGTLMRLHHSGACDVSSIASHLGVTNAAASQMIDRLVQMDLLERTEDPHDRRSKVIALTPMGEQVVQESVAARTQWMGSLAVEFTPEQQELIMRALRLLTEAVEKIDSGNSFKCEE